MTTAILVTWRDMADTLTEFVTRAQNKYGEKFQKFYFEDEDAAAEILELLTLAEPNLTGSDAGGSSVQPARAPQRIKIFIAGHGGIGIDAIGSAGNQRKTVDQLSAFLKTALDGIATRANRARVQVNMVACLFGRSHGDLPQPSPASKLYAALIAKDIFVELVSRTEYVKVLESGLHTMAVSDKREGASNEQELPFFHRKRPYTKIRHTFDNDKVVQSAVGFSRSDLDLADEANSKYLWADRTVTELTALIRTANDMRVPVLQAVLSHYANLRDPETLRNELRQLVNSKSTSKKLNFTLHRNLFSRLGNKLPKKAEAIQAVLLRWPGP
jgi:hypothetical protein